MIKLLIKLVGLFFLGFLFYLGQKHFTTTFFKEGQIGLLTFNYLFNGIAALIILGNLYLISKINKDFLGFLLILLSVIKILIYVAMIKSKGYTLERDLFLEIFLPYSLGKTIEILGLIGIMRVANRQEVSEL